MDPAYLTKKIIDLSDAELIALGFMGENVAPGVKRIVDKVKAHPDHLGSVTCFMVDRVKNQCYPVQAPSQDATQPPASPNTLSIPPTVRDTDNLGSKLSKDSDAHTVVAPNLISEFDMKFWYRGISSDPPKLMWRSDIDANPFPTRQPGSRFFNIPTKTVHGVFNTPLNDVWHIVAPQILESIKAHGIKYSALKTARFSTAVDGKEKLGPVVVWIAVRPNTTNAETVRGATPDILRILADAKITGVVVEWYEASVVRLVGPPLMRVEAKRKPKFGLNHAFNSGLGIPIARQSDDSQGTLTLLFKEMKTSSGDPSERILALTSKHVASVDNDTDYEFDGANPQHILVCGDRRFALAVAEINHAVTTGLRDAVRLAGEIEDYKLNLGTPKEDLTILREKQDALDDKNEDNAILQAFTAEVDADWQDTNGRRLGVVDWAPKISVNVDDHHYTRDIATFAIDGEKLKNFGRNIVDLGNQYTVIQLEDLFWPVAAVTEGRTIPTNLQLPIRRAVTSRLVTNPDTNDENGNPLYIVGKYGHTTKLTLGRYSGMEAYICTDLGLESREMVIYNYGKNHGEFSDHGDSGSLIFTGDGDALAILHSGMSHDMHNHATYATPIWWVIKQLLVKYPFADFYGITYSLD